MKGWKGREAALVVDEVHGAAEIDDRPRPGGPGDLGGAGSRVTALSSFEDIGGKHWKEKSRQRIKEVACLMKVCDENGVEYGEEFPPRQGAAVAAGEEETGGKGPEEEEE
ncbi:MAG: hypothetical protein EOP84_08505 [Verrucomicrobiaceae bacterium]|nr:MAG: hypothetical protein EOP84_08505 [Verrucomicrobiaceae bacterium]